MSDINKLYANLKEDGYQLGTESEFVNNLKVPEKARKFYENMKADGYNLGEWEEFQNKTGIAYPAMKPDQPTDKIPGFATREEPLSNQQSKNVIYGDAPSSTKIGDVTINTAGVDYLMNKKFNVKPQQKVQENINVKSQVLDELPQTVIPTSYDTDPSKEQKVYGWYNKYIQAINQGASTAVAGGASFMENLSKQEKELFDVPIIRDYFGVTEKVFGAVKDYFNNDANKSNVIAQVEAGKDFTDFWKEGRYMDAAQSVYLEATKSLPLSLATVGSTMAGMPGVGLSMMYASSTGNQIDQLKGRTDMSEAEKQINAHLTGIIEAGSELIGDVPIGNMLKQLYNTGGEALVKKTIKSNMTNWMSGIFSKSKLLAPVVMEGIEEAGGQIGQNAVSYATGETDSLDLMKDVGKSFAYGAAGGSQFSAVAAPKMIKNKVQQKQAEKKVNQFILNADTQAEKTVTNWNEVKTEIQSLDKQGRRTVLENTLKDQTIPDNTKQSISDYITGLDYLDKVKERWQEQTEANVAINYEDGSNLYLKSIGKPNSGSIYAINNKVNEYEAKLGEEFASMSDEQVIDYLDNTDLTEEQSNDIENYLSIRSNLNGAIQAMNSKAQSEIDQIHAEIDSTTREDGTRLVVTTPEVNNEPSQTLYVLDGNIALDENGNVVRSASDTTLVAKNEQGETVELTVNDIATASYQNAQEAKNKIADDIFNRYAQQFSHEAETNPTDVKKEEGATITWYENGKPHQGIVIDKADGFVRIQEGKKIVLKAEAELNEQLKNPTIIYHREDKIPLVLDGQQFEGEITADADEQGKYTVNVPGHPGKINYELTAEEITALHPDNKIAPAKEEITPSTDESTPVEEITPEQQAEQQAEQEKQKFIETLPKIKTGNKAGRVDTKKLTPEQAFQYTKVTEDTETAIKDLKADIFSIDTNIRELEKKLNATTGTAKIDIREDIKELKAKREGLKSILDREAPGLEAEMKAQAEKKAQIEAEVKAKNEAIAEAQKNRVLTDAEKEGLHNNIVSLLKEHNEIPPSHTQKRRAIFNEINKKSSLLGYSVNVEPGGHFIVKDKEGKPIRTIAQRTSQEEVEAHPLLTEYTTEFQAFALKLMQSMPETLDFPNTNVEKAVKDILAGTKTVAANRMLDGMNEMFSNNEIIIRATAFTPEVVISIEEYFALFQAESKPEQQLINTIPDEILNELLGDGEMTDEISNYLNDLYNETYNQINGRAEAESTAAGIIRNAEEGVSGEKGTADQQQGEVSTPINYKNGDTVTYKGKQYTVSAYGTDGDGNPIYDLELNGKTVFEDVMESELGGEVEEVKPKDLEKFVIGERELRDIIKRSPTPDFEDFQNEAVGAYTHLIEPNETITRIELAKRIAKAYDLYNQRNRIDFSAIWYMGNKEIKHTLNGVSVKWKHKGNVSTPEVKPENKKEYTGVKAKIQKVLDNYEDSVNMTMNDVISDILTVAYDNDIAEIQEAYKTYENELLEDREQWGERGDREAIEDNFMQVVNDYLNQSEQIYNDIKAEYEAEQAEKQGNKEAEGQQGMSFEEEQKEPVRRFEAGKKLTDQEKRDIIKTMKDAYKVNNRPSTLDENDKLLWLDNSTDFMETSDITGRKLRWFIELPDGKIAHPTEIYPQISPDDITRAERSDEQFTRDAERGYKKGTEKLSEIKNKVVDQLERGIDAGITFVKEYDSSDIREKNPTVTLKTKIVSDYNPTGVRISVQEYMRRNNIDIPEINDFDWERYYNENKPQSHKSVEDMAKEAVRKNDSDESDIIDERYVKFISEHKIEIDKISEKSTSQHEAYKLGNAIGIDIKKAGFTKQEKREIANLIKYKRTLVILPSLDGLFDGYEGKNENESRYTANPETFKYRLTRRPPSIGTHPTENLIGDPIQTVNENGIKEWVLTYSKKLDPKEVAAFELTPVIDGTQYVGKQVQGIFGKYIYTVKKVTPDFVNMETTASDGRTTTKDMPITQFVNGIDEEKYKVVEEDQINENNPKADKTNTDHKQKQLDIILQSNPMLDDIHTGIRTIDDIKTFQETLDDKEYKEYYDNGDDFSPDYTAKMAIKAIETGEITVYSSKPIAQGTFISPSKMEAEAYSADGKTYSKVVKLEDIAWVDPHQGQYANVNEPAVDQEDNNGVMFQAVSPIGFYSTVEKALEAIQQERGTKDQFRAMLLKNGAKQAEMDWMGFDELPEKLTKADIQNWINENRIEVEEVEKNDNPQLNLDKYYDFLINKYGDIENAGEEMLATERNKMEQLQNEVKYQTNETKFSQYVLPGGENYKELLLTMPEKFGLTEKEKAEKETLARRMNNEINMPQRDIDRYNELERKSGQRIDNNFKSSHFDEPNILAHVRFNERIVNGERVLFIEEFQSDWAQKGKKEGFKSDSRKVIAESLRKEKDNFYAKLNQSEDEQVEYGLSQFESGKITREQLDKILLANGYSEYDLKSAAETNSVPDMPFKKTDQWVNLAIRRMMRYAAENSTFGSVEWQNATKPQSIWKQLEDNLSSELAAIIPLKVMDIPVLLSTKNNDIRRIVIQSIPIDVMNILSNYRINPESLFSKDYMFSDIIPIETRSTIAGGLANSLQLIGTRLRTAFDGILSSDTSRRNEEVLPTISARQFDPAIIVGLLSPSRIYGINGNNSILGHSGTLPATKLSITGINNTLVSREWSSAELASLLNWHNNLINGTSNSITKYVPNTGYDRIAWTSGEIQAERYDLSKQVDEVYYNPKTKEFGYFVKADPSPKVYPKTEPKDIENYVGKELARKLLETPINSEDLQSIKGDGLKVGGEGMKIFYDAIVPSAMSKLGKPFGAKVEAIEIPETGLQQSIPVTDLMKETAMAGMPLYHTGTTMQPATTEEVAATVEQLLKTGLAKEVHMVTLEEIAGILEGNEQLQTTLPATIDVDGVQRPTTNSNGKPIHSTEEGIRNFWRWFGNSKVTDNEGRPLVVYHATDADYDVFEPNRSDIGIHFGTSKQADNLAVRKSATRNATELYKDGMSVLPIYARILNPIRLKDDGRFQSYDVLSQLKDLGIIDKNDPLYKRLQSTGRKTLDDVTEFLLSKGYDGIVYINKFEDSDSEHDSFIALSPNQIKSATGNFGSFASDNADIRYMRTPSGTIYGFVKGGIVYLNSSTLNLNTPIHEFGHLWIDNIEVNHKALFEKGAELIKETIYWERVNTDPNYKDLSETARIKEAMAMAIGDKGESVVNDNGLKAKLKRWISDVWKRIGSAFGINNLTSEQISKLSFRDFVDIATSELLSGENLTENELSNPFRRLDKAYEAKEYEEKKEVPIRKALIDNNIPVPSDVWKDADKIYEPKRTIYNDNNIGVSLYKRGISEIKFIHSRYGHLLRFDSSDKAPQINKDDASRLRDLINPAIDRYVGMLQQVKHLSTPAAQQSINELIEDARLSKDYYDRYASGEDVWRTEKAPRFQIIGEQGASNLDAAEEATIRMDNLQVAKEMESGNPLDTLLNDYLTKGSSLDNEKLMDYYGLKRFTLQNKYGFAVLSLVQAKENGKGSGTKIMRDLSLWADKNKISIALTPDTSFGATSVSRLKEFYKRFGFKDNSGKSKDFSTRESMIRTPKELKQFTPQEIRLATGWERGADGKFRYETTKHTIHHQLQDYLDKTPDGFSKWYTARLNHKLNVNLIDIFGKEDETLKALPQLRNIPVKFASDADMNGAAGDYDPETKSIRLNVRIKADKDKIFSVLEHEVQHAIQEIEGFAKGGNTSQFNDVKNIDNLGLYDVFDKIKSAKPKSVDEVKSLKTKILGDNPYMYESDNWNRVIRKIENGSVSLTDIIKTPYEQYHSLAGEVEARNAAIRKDYTPEQRRNTLLSETADVSPEDQIIIFDGLGISMSMSEDEIQEKADKIKKDGLKSTIPDYTKFLSDVLKDCPKRNDIEKQASELGWDLQKAIEDYMATFAMKGTSKAEMERVMKLLGLEDFSRGEVKMFLWDNANPNDGTPEWIAKRAMAYNNAKDNSIPKFPTSAQLAEYNEQIGNLKLKGMAKVKNFVFRFEESYMNQLASMRVFMDIVGKYGEVPDKYNPYYLSQLRTSAAQTSLDRYEKKEYKSLMEGVNNLNKELKKSEGLVYLNKDYKSEKGTIDAATLYALAKAGLGRNERLAREEAENTYKEVYAALEAKHAEGKLTDEKYKEKKSKIDAKRDETADRLNKSNDYGGLTGLSDLVGSGAMDFEDVRKVVEDIVAEAEKAVNTDEFWNTVKKATSYSLKYQYDRGMMTKQMYEHVLNLEPHYLPLRGYDEETAGDLFEYFTQHKGNFNPVLKKATGHAHLPENPFAHLLSMTASGIMQAENNKVKLALLNLVENNKNDIISIKDTWIRNIGTEEDPEWVEAYPKIPVDATSEEVLQALEDFETQMQTLKQEGRATIKHKNLQLGLPIGKGVKSEHAITVKRNGQEQTLYVNGNPRLAQAINGMLNPDTQDMSKVFKFIRSINRGMSANFTSRNIEFAITNTMRDMHMAVMLSTIDEGFGYSYNLMKNLAVCQRTIASALFGTGTKGKYQDYWNEYLENGGQTGFVQLRSIEQYNKDVEKLQRQMNKKDALAVPKWVFKQIGDINNMAEQITRFATYVTSREAGRTPIKSAIDAKNITLNFNQKGSGEMGARWLQTLVLFFNPAMQALYRANQSRQKHPGRFWTVMGLHAAAGSLVPLLGLMLAKLFGDDDDEIEEAYFNTPEWIRRNNLMIWIPGTKSFVKYPLGQELRWAYSIGEIGLTKAMGQEKYGSSIGKQALESVSALLPVDIFGASHWYIPGFVAPVYESKINENFMGKPIYKETPFNTNDPEWTKAYKNTWKPFVSVSKKINEIAGGDDVSKGKIDINPAISQHLVEGYLGGMVSVYLMGAEQIGKVLSGEEISMNDIPIARRVYSVSDNQYYDNSLRREYFDIYNDLKKGVDHKLQKYGKIVNEYDRRYNKNHETLTNEELERWGLYLDKLNTLKQTKDYYKLMEYKQAEKAKKQWEKEGTPYDEANLIKQVVDNVKLIDEAEATKRVKAEKEAKAEEEQTED